VISFSFPDAVFHYRVAAVAIHEGHVLMHRAVGDDFWALPGGRCEILEPSTVALVRELREEAGEPVTVERPLWIVENFFMLNGKRRHEIGLYYLVTLPPASRLLDVSREHAGIEGDVPLVFRWLPTAQLPYLPVYPVFLRAALQALPDTMQHIVNCDDREAERRGGAVSILPQ
jgi:8-oxo-dGTP pyrophosphatase MutT (NUDIX family)